ncbi:MAG: D-alanyl-D-alanine carboxypeptidase family protein [Alphaproteobacteria bacterium]
MASRCLKAFIRPGSILTLIGALAIAAAPLRAETIDSPANHIILMDAQSGDILIDKDGEAQMPPASMSKLMTLEIVFHDLKTGKLKMDDTFPVSEKAWAMKKSGTDEGAGSLMYVGINDNIKVSDLLRGIIVDSGNDACVVVAEGLAGSDEDFAKLMNKRAKELGLTGSHFANSYGWPDPEEYVTARDLAVLAQHIITEYPDYYKIFSEREFTWEKIHQYNRDPLLGSMEGADGLKTGHTEASGYGLVASAMRDGRRLILVVNGLASQAQRKSESMRLLQYGFRNFDTYKLLQANQVVAAAQVYGGKKSEVPLVVQTPVTKLMSRDARENMKVSVDYNAPLKAPIRAGVEVGKLTINIPGTAPTVNPVYTADSVGGMSPFQAMGAGLQHLFFGAMGPNAMSTPLKGKKHEESGKKTGT